MEREEYIQMLAKGFYALAMRNGPLENYHAERRPVGDSEMEAVNRYAYNVLCRLIQWIIDGEMEKVISICTVEALTLSYFDAPDYDSDEVKRLDTIYQLVKEMGLPEQEESV